MESGVLGHCLLCSLACPIGAEHWWTARYGKPLEAEAGGRGLCGRGSALVELFESAARTRDAVQRGRGGQPRLSGQAILDGFNRMVDEARGKGRIGAVVDGNLPCEDLLAAHLWAQRLGGDTVAALHLPPSDFDLWEGLSAAGAPLVGPDGLGEFDAAVVVGDALTTHPGLARPLLSARYARPALPVVVMDTHAGRTAQFGELFLRVEPERQADLLDALRVAAGGGPLEQTTAALKQVVALGHADEKAVARMMAGLRAAGRLAVVLAAEPTKASDWRRVAGAAAELAKARRGAILPLAAYGNSLGAYHLHRNLPMPRFESLLCEGEDDWALLVFVGVDPTLTYPEEILRPLFRRDPGVVVAAAVETPLWRRAELGIALALPLEYEGHVLRGHGEEVALARILPAMPGALRACELFALPTEGERPAGWEAAWRERPAPASPPAPPAEPAPAARLRLLAAASPIQFGDGALTRHAAWIEHLPGESELLLSPLAAERLRIREGDPVRVRRNGQTLTLACSLCHRLPADLALAPLHQPEVRCFLPWQLDAAGCRLTCPAPGVEIEKVAEASPLGGRPAA